MAAVWLWVRAEWRRRWGALVGLALVIALGGGMMLALAAGARRADSAFGRLDAATGGATVVMSVLDAGPPTDMAAANRHLEVLDEARALDGVEAVQVQTWFGAQPDFLQGPPDGDGLVEAFSQGYGFVDPKHPPFLVVQGALPAPDDPQGVVVNEAAARLQHVTVGSTFTFHTAAAGQFEAWGRNDGSVASLDGPDIPAVVRAVVRSPASLVDPDQPDMAIMPGIATAYRDRIVQCACFVLVRAAPGKADTVLAELERLYSPYGLVARDAETQTGVAGSVTDSIAVEVTTLTIAAAVAALASLLVIAQFAARVASTSALDDDTRRALGQVRAQRAGGVALVLAPALVVGTAAATTLAYAASGLFPRGVARDAEPEPGLRFDAVVQLAGALALLVAVGATFGAIAWSTGRVRPNRTPRQVSRIVRAFSSLPQRALGASFAVDPVGGQRVGAVALSTFAGVVLAVAGVVTVATVQDSRHEAATSPARYGAPAAYVFGDNSARGSVGAIEAAMAQPDVTAVTRVLALDDGTTPASGPSRRPVDVTPQSFEPLRGSALPVVLKGSLPQGRDEVALGPATARDLGAQVGDTVTVAGIDGERTMRVIGQVLSWSVTDAGHAFVVTPQTSRELVCPNAVEDGCNALVTVWADAPDGPAASALVDAGFVAVFPPANLARFSQVGDIPWYLALLLVVLGLGGLAHALYTSLHRRRRELAIGRAIGWRGRQAGSVFLWQAVLTAFAGGVAGALAGVVVGRVVWHLIADGLDIVDRPVVPATTIALAVVGAVTAAVLLALPPLARAIRMRTGHVLRAE